MADKKMRRRARNECSAAPINHHTRRFICVARYAVVRSILTAYPQGRFSGCDNPRMVLLRTRPQAHEISQGGTQINSTLGYFVNYVSISPPHHGIYR
jgi:hypothetical protein